MEENYQFSHLKKKTFDDFNDNEIYNQEQSTIDQSKNNQINQFESSIRKSKNDYQQLFLDNFQAFNRKEKIESLAQNIQQQKVLTNIEADLFQQINTIQYPREVLDFMQKHQNYYFEHIQEYQHIIFFQNNVFCFYHYEIDENFQQFCETVEESLLIQQIKYCGHVQGNEVYLVYLEDNTSQFYCLNQQRKLLKASIKFSKTLKQIYYSFNSNKTFVVDKNDELHLLNIDIVKQKAQTLKISFDNQNQDLVTSLYNKASDKIARMSDFLLNGIQKREAQFFFKEFFNYIIILQKNFIIKNESQQLKSQQFVILQIQQDQGLKVYRKFDLQEIIQYNINLIDQMELKQQLFKDSVNINDFLFDQNQFLLLLSSGIELQFNCVTKMINQITMISLKQIVFSNICFEQYFDKNQILASDQDQQFIIDKTMICPLILFDSNQIQSYALLPMEKFGMYSLIKMNNKSQSIYEGQIFIKFDTTEGIQIFRQLRDIDFFIDLLYIDYSIEKGKNSKKYFNFYKEFFHLKNCIKNNDFQTLIFEALLQYNSVIKKKENFFLKSMQYRFSILQNDLYDEFFQHSVILQSLLKYILLFNFNSIKTQKQYTYMIQENYNKKERQIKDFDYVFLQYLFDMFQKIGPQVIFVSQQKKPLENVQLIYQIDNLIYLQTQLDRVVFLLNQKDINMQEIQNSFIYTMKILNQLKTTNYSQNFNEQFSTLIQPSICDIVSRIKYVLQFCNYCFLVKNKASVEALQTIQNIEIQSLIFYDKNNQKIKSFLGLTGQFYDDNKQIFNLFMDKNEISALKLLQDYVNDYNSIKNNHFDVISFIQSIKHLSFDIISYYLELFWANNDFKLYTSSIINRFNYINDKIDPVLKTEANQIQTLIFAVIVQLLNSIANNKKKQGGKLQVVSGFCNKLKNSILMKDVEQQETKQFFLEKELQQLNLTQCKDLLQNTINMILKSPIPQLRKKLLFLLFKKNNSYIKNINYQYKLDDLIDLRTNEDLFQGDIGKENVDYMIKFFNEKKQYENCLKLIIAVLEKQGQSRFFEQFKMTSNILALLDPNQLTKIQNQVPQYETFNLDFQKAFLKTAIKAEKKINIDKIEQKKIKETLQAIKIQLNLNIRICKELHGKKRILERIQMLKSIKVDQKQVKKFLDFLEIQIRIINLNPKIEHDSFSEKVIKINKLHMTLLQECYKSLISGNSQYQQKLENALVYFGNFNTTKSIGKISNHFNLTDDYKNKSFFSLYSSTDKVDDNLFNELQKYYLIFPLNVPSEFQYILEDYLLEQKYNIEDLKNLFRKIETLNISSKYLQLMITNLNYNNGIKDNNVLWHLYFLYNLFNSQKPKQDLSLVYLILEVYNQLIQEQNQTGDLIKENLTSKYIHTFVNIYELVIVSAKQFIQNRDEREEVKKFLNKFQSLNSHLIQILKDIKKIKPSTFASYELQTYFKSQEKISKLITYGVAVQNMTTFQNQFNQTIICAFLKSFYSFFFLILYSINQQNIKTIQTIAKTTKSFASQERPDFIIILYSNAVYSFKKTQNIEQTNIKDPIKQISACIKFQPKNKLAIVVSVAPIQVYKYISSSSLYGNIKFISKLNTINPAKNPIKDLYMALNQITSSKKNTAVKRAIE